MNFFLIVENKSFREYLMELLNNNGDECLELNDVTDIISEYEKYRPDWLVIDLGMQGQNGFKLAEMIKSQFTRAKIALLSDFDDERLRLKAEKIGVDAFVVKENLLNFDKIIYRK